MSLFKGKDKDLPLLTQFYQIEEENDEEMAEWIADQYKGSEPVLPLQILEAINRDHKYAYKYLYFNGYGITRDHKLVRRIMFSVARGWLDKNDLKWLGESQREVAREFAAGNSDTYLSPSPDECYMLSDITLGDHYEAQDHGALVIASVRASLLHALEDAIVRQMRNITSPAKERLELERDGIDMESLSGEDEFDLVLQSQEFGDRPSLLICAECENVFEVTRQGQKYCSLRCSSRATSRVHRNKSQNDM